MTLATLNINEAAKQIVADTLSSPKMASLSQREILVRLQNYLTTPEAGYDVMQAVFLLNIEKPEDRALQFSIPEIIAAMQQEIQEHLAVLANPARLVGDDGPRTPDQ